VLAEDAVKAAVSDWKTKQAKRNAAKSTTTAATA
jgi:hypothetical protein